MYDYGDGIAFACDECPICEDWERRLMNAKKHPEWGDPQFEYCYCDKIGTWFGQGGYCCDAFTKTRKPKGMVLPKGRAYRRAMTRNAKERQKRMVRENQPVHFWWKYKLIDGIWQEADYIQEFSSEERKKFHKKMAKRKVRRTKHLPTGKSGYKRCYDLAWMVDY